MMKNYLILLLAFFYNICINAYEKYTFENFSVANGLSQKTAYTMAQDKRGYIWIGTEIGLNKFDGISFKQYYHDPNDACSIANNKILSLYYDNESLWIGTSLGLSKYIPEHDNFINYCVPDTPLEVYDIITVPSTDRLLLATDKGLAIFDIKQKTTSLLPSLNSITVLNLCRIKDTIIMGTDNGVFSYDDNTKHIINIIPSLKGKTITDFIYDSALQTIWISTFGNGLYKADEKFNIIQCFEKDNSGLHSNFIRKIEIDNMGQLWIGALDGLFLLSSDRTNISEITNYNKKNLYNKSVRSIIKDAQNGIWIGTYHDGIFYYHDKKTKFDFQDFEIENTPLSGHISCIVEDTINKTIWIGSSVEGLYQYDILRRKLKKYSVDGEQNKLLCNIKCLIVDTDGSIILGTHLNGIIHIDPRFKSVKQYNITVPKSENNSCYSLCKTENNNVLIGTSNGLYIYNTQSHKMTKYNNREVNNLLISHIFRDCHNRIWLCSNKSTYYISNDEKLEEVYYITKTSKEKIPSFSVISTENGTVWINSSNGLYKYISENERIELITFKEGLPCNAIYGMLEDMSNNIWINTNKGIVCFSPLYKTFKLYSYNDGVHPNIYEQYGYCKTNDGFFLFTGDKGINIFNPNTFTDNPFQTTPIISSCNIQGNAITESPKHYSIYYNCYGELSSIKVPANEENITINYSAIDYFSGRQNLFSYKLEGIEENWNQTNRRSVSYHNLKPGEYTFLLRAANSTGLWSDTLSSLTITIEPLWYQTWYFKVILYIMLISIMFYIIRSYIVQSKTKIELESERLDKERLQEISQEKIRFYTNISHELRTPINLILSPLEELMGNNALDENLSNKISYIYNNSKKLLRIINQELDSRRAESDVLPLNASFNDISIVINEVYDMFSNKAQEKELQYKFINEISNDKILCDASYIEKITVNLISNAIKFSSFQGLVTIKIKKEDNNFIIEVSNTGEEIPKDKIELIFNRFYKADERHVGLGIGLSLVKSLVDKHHGRITVTSKENDKTTFAIYIPQDISIYSQNEISVMKDENKKISINDYIIDNNESINIKNTSLLDTEENVSGNILIVTENNEMRNYLYEYFSHKYNVLTSETYESAIISLKKENIDIVLSDVSLSSKNGINLCSDIKKNLQTCHIPVLLMSDYGGDDLHLQSIMAGAEDLILKPFSISMLEGKINNMFMLKKRIHSHLSGELDTQYSLAASNETDKEFINNVIQVIEDNINNEDFTPDDLAQQLNMGRSTLYTRMSTIAGEAPANFIRKVRIEKACKLLIEGKYRISEISDMVGFSTPSYFTSCFKKYKGCLPKEYIKKIKSEKL